jgi:hypothetical protein
MTIISPKIFDILPKKEIETNTKYSLELYLDEAAALFPVSHVTLPKLKGSSAPTSPVIRRSSSARELSHSAPLILPPASCTIFVVFFNFFFSY